jgi:predicted MPP superfamily phosphohydrolase
MNAQPGITRRQLLRRTVGVALLPLAAGGYGSQIEPFWVDYHLQPMPLRRLHPSLAGYRIAQLTDLHVSDIVPMSYLREVVGRVNRLNVDLTVVTGDLVSKQPDHSRYSQPVADLLAELSSPVVVTFGNHDYLVDWQAAGGHATRAADALADALAGRGITVLRNQALWIAGRGKSARPGAAPTSQPDPSAQPGFWLVGLDDCWAGQFDPQRAFAGVNLDEPVIALSHNPDTAPVLCAYRPQWILSGHTHGGQVRVPGWGAPLLPIQNLQYDQGHFDLGHSHLYVSRGVGYLARMRFCCRPEVPVFVLQSAP